MSVELRDGRLAVAGPVTLQTVEALVARGDALIGEGARVIDLSGVAEVDSASLAMLLHWIRAARAAGRELSVANAPASLRSLARLYDLEPLVLGP
jgi:phospholipid transport system transporter-binding protein